MKKIKSYKKHTFQFNIYPVNCIDFPGFEPWTSQVPSQLLPIELFCLDYLYQTKKVKESWVNKQKLKYIYWSVIAKWLECLLVMLQTRAQIQLEAMIFSIHN